MICRICVGKGDLVPRAGFAPKTDGEVSRTIPSFSILGIANINFSFSLFLQVINLGNKVEVFLPF